MIRCSAQSLISSFLLVAWTSSQVMRVLLFHGISLSRPFCLMGISHTLSHYPVASGRGETRACPLLWVLAHGPSELQSLTSFLSLNYRCISLDHFPVTTAPYSVPAAPLELLFYSPGPCLHCCIQGATELQPTRETVFSPQTPGSY